MRSVLFAAVAALSFGTANVHAALCSANKADHNTPKEYQVYNKMQSKVRSWYDWTKSDENQGLVKRATVRIVAGTPLIIADGVVETASIATDEVHRVVDTVEQAYQDVSNGGTIPEMVAFVTVDPVSKAVHFTTVNATRAGVLVLGVIDATQANLFDASSELFIDISDMLANAGKSVGGDTGETVGNVLGAPFVVAAFVFKGAEMILSYVLVDYGVNLVATTGEEVGDLVCDLGDTLGYIVRLDPENAVESFGGALVQTVEGTWSVFKALIKPVTDLVDVIDEGSAKGRKCLKSGQTEDGKTCKYRKPKHHKQP